ncbi:MAG: NAD(P)/FAD-dependent oxidoreductase [Candidatus Eremiobacteraeota bacterium]|nr:NAD(P)/FAD-dependent oxidoreductase [Candidatus Eremiobacteraeota bacterium]
MTAARIAILGGGFGGLTATRTLERLLHPGEAELTLVSDENFSVFTPMLPEVGSGNLETRHIVTPVRAQLRRTRFILGRVTGVDLESRRIDVEHPLDGSRRTIEYDHVVFALGSTTSTFGLPGVAERTLPYKTLEDAERLRNRTIAMLERAAVSQDEAERRRFLAFAFVGGGFTGVEAAGELVDFFKSVGRYYPSIAEAEISISLIEAGAKLLPELQVGMGEYSALSLERRGVRVLLNAPVASVDAEGLHLKDGTTIAAATIVWSAGVRPSPVVAALPTANARGALAVQPDLSVKGRSGVWALGDCASILRADGTAYPATAQHAIREGPVLARNIVATLRGRATKPFAFEAIGMMASLGGRRGVAGIRGKYLLTGFLAWVLWRTYYLARLPGIDRRLRVTVDWTLGLLFPRDIAELRVYAKHDLPSDN